MDLFLGLEEQVKGPHGEEFIASIAKKRDRPVDEVRKELFRHTEYAMERARRELGCLAEEAFERLAVEAFVMIGGFLAALAMDRMPDSFDPSTRREARDDALSRAEGVLRGWLNVGRPRNQPLMPEDAREFVRLAAVGRELFASPGHPVDAETLTSIDRAIRKTLPDAWECKAAQEVVEGLRTRQIKGKDIQRNKLALRFAANVMRMNGSTRTLQRLYDDALEVIRAG